MPSEVRDLFDPIKESVLALHAYWKLFRQLYMSGPERVALLNATGGQFFSVVQEVLRDSLFIGIGRLTDPPKTFGKDNLSFQSLAELISHTDNDLFSHQVKPTLDSLKARSVAFRDWRNRRLAHSDLRTSLRTHPDPLPGVSPSDVDSILAEMSRLMNSIQVHYSDTTTMYDYVLIEGDADRMADALERAQKHRECERREFEKQWGLKGS